MQRYGIDARPLYSVAAGIPIYTRSLIEGISSELEDDEELLLYLPTPILPTSRHWRSWYDIRIHFADYEKVSIGGTRNMLWLHALLETKIKLKILPVDSLLPNICTYHSTNYEMARCRRAMKIITMYDLAAIRMPELHSKRQLNRAKHYRSLCQNADRIVCISRSTQRDVVELLGVDEEKTRVIYLAAGQRDKGNHSSNEIDEVKQKLRIVGKYIVYLGTIEPRKNLVNLIKSYNRLMDARQHDHSLVLAGGMGWLYDDIIREAAHSPYRSKIKFLGRVDSNDIGPLLSGADMFVYPSLMEGFGLPVLEAFACRVPVLTSNTSSLAEVAGDAAFKVNPTDVGEITDGMLMLLSDGELCNRLRKKGINRLKQFSWEKCARQTVELYRGCVRQ